MHKKGSVILFVIILLPSIIFAQDSHLLFTPINTQDGLANNKIRSINQLTDGRMIFVTQGLLNIYNGTHFIYLHYNESQPYILKEYTGFHRLYVEDNGRIWLKNDHKLFLFDMQKEAYVSNLKEYFAGMGVINKVLDFFLLNDRYYWMITKDHHLISYDINTQTLKNHYVDLSSFYEKHDQIYDLGMIGHQLFLFFKSGKMICYDLNLEKEVYQDSTFNTLFEDSYAHTLLVVPYKKYLYQLRNGYNKGSLVRYNIDSRKWDKILETNHTLNTLTINQSGQIWVSAIKGFYTISPSLKEKKFTSTLRLINGDKIETEISTQYHDNNGGLWIGTQGRGLLYFHPNRFKFKYVGKKLFKSLDVGVDLIVKSITSNDTSLMLGTNRGVYYYDLMDKLSVISKIPANIDCNHLYKDSSGSLWICTLNSGIYCMYKNHVKHYKTTFNAYDIYEDLNSGIFLGSSEGLMVLDREMNDFVPVLEERNNDFTKVHNLSYYGNNTLWGISNSGIFIYDISSNRISRLSTDEAPFNNINQLYNDLFVDSRDLKWVGTQDGLYLLDQDLNLVNVFYIKNGLVNNTIRSIFEDQDKNIWISTANGLSRIEISGEKEKYKFSIVNFNHFDGVLKEEFYQSCVHQRENGSIAWGGVDGFNMLNPNDIREGCEQIQRPLLVNLFLAGVKVKQHEVYEDRRVLSKSISYTDTIKLKHNQNFFGLEFSSCNYLNPSQMYYSYILEGFDSKWNNVRSANGLGKANYTNVPPGEYSFKVMAFKNPSGRTNDIKTLSIFIETPFYKSKWAFYLYIIISTTITFGVIYAITLRHKRNIKQKQSEELEQLKYHFFTNLGHDLRTPLTLILTPLESILKNLQQVELKSQLSNVYKNAYDLLQLVNQLLDYRRMETHGEVLRLNYTHIGELVERIIHTFEETLMNKDIAFKYNNSVKNLHIYIDKRKFERMINNLLSNALKYTHSEISFDISFSEPNHLQIQIMDNGSGIPQKDIPNIFKRFYRLKKHEQSHTGTGIGLHLVKEYLTLHKGEINVVSEENKGTAFNLTIPTDLKADEVEKKQNIISLSPGKDKILVVEDNDEFRAFLHTQLSDYYMVKTAPNGKEGIQLTHDFQPNLIISDLFMPIMDGLEFCKKHKEDINSSHIPLIILSARNAESSQIDCFKAGADAYITKPFSMDILLLRIHNLLTQQKERIAQFKKAIVIQPNSVTTTKIDSDLIKRAIEIIENNMDNPNFSVDQLSKDLYMDRTGLYRKIKAITDQTPSDFIRSIKLKKATILLEKGFSVSDVSMQVGFNTVSYFSKCFQMEFGVKPSKWLEGK